MTKRGAGEGALYRIRTGKHAGKWRAAATISLPGEPQRKRTFIGKTREEARQRLLDAQRQGLVPRAASRANDTIADLVHDRLRERTDRVKPRTIEQYRNIARLHIDPYIGTRRAAAMTPEDFDRYFERLTAAGASAHIRRLCRAVLSGTFRWAVKRKRLPANPLDVVDAPAIPRKRMRTWNASEVARFLAAARTDRLYAFFALAIASGMRLGELIALQWTDVDLKRGRVSIQETASEHGAGDVKLGSAKTKGSVRGIELPALAVDALREQREAALEAPRMLQSPYVFPDTQGGLLQARNVRERHFKPLMHAAGVPKIRFHDLRHTLATLALGAGVPLKIVSEMLGHESGPEFTARVYQHSTETLQTEAAAKIDDVLRGVTKRRP